MLPDRGSYALVFRVNRRTEVSVGSLGNVTVEAGSWAYVGSGTGRGPSGLRGRLGRHLKSAREGTEKPHWHIDYLLSQARPEVEGAWIIEGDRECELAAILAEMVPGIQGFGCSDCHCETHLFRAGIAETAEAVRRVGGGIFLPAPTLERWVSRR
ncbi:GIY-YIG nuclease family protein [Methanopyrus sp.]